jgi:hypothetical protein
MTMECPAAMCPLIAPNGSPWTGKKHSACPGHDDMDTDGCAWWSIACSTGGIQALVNEAAENAGAGIPVLGPNKPRRHTIGPARTYDCHFATICRWQEQAGDGKLCPPRDALARGIDPRVCLF